MWALAFSVIIGNGRRKAAAKVLVRANAACHGGFEQDNNNKRGGGGSQMKNYDFQKSFVSFQKVFNDFFWNEGTKGKKKKWFPRWRLMFQEARNQRNIFYFKAKNKKNV